MLMNKTTPSTTRLRTIVIAAIACAVIPGRIAAQTFIYTNNDISGPNSVSGFSVGSGGVLTPILGRSRQ
jgi:hypothetical protein